MTNQTPDQLRKLRIAEHALNLMVAGVKVTKIKVGQIAEEVGAPTKRMNAKALLNWVSDKIMILSLNSKTETKAA